MPKKEPKYLILNSLFGVKAGKTALSSACGISPAKTSKNLDELLLVEVVKKDSSGRTYSLNPKILFVILKLSGNKAEIISYTSDSKAKREPLEPISSMNDDENTLYFIQSAKEYCRSLSDRYFEIISCIIYDKNNAAPPYSGGFALCKSRAELIADSLADKYPDSSLLYLNLEDPFCLLCKNGVDLAADTPTPEAISESLASLLSLLKPDSAILDGEPNDAIASVSKCARLPLTVLPKRTDGLYLDELEALLLAALSHTEK